MTQTIESDGVIDLPALIRRAVSRVIACDAAGLTKLGGLERMLLARYARNVDIRDIDKPVRVRNIHLAAALQVGKRTVQRLKKTLIAEGWLTSSQVQSRSKGMQVCDVQLTERAMTVLGFLEPLPSSSVKATKTYLPAVMETDPSDVLACANVAHATRYSQSSSKSHPPAGELFGHISSVAYSIGKFSFNAYNVIKQVCSTGKTAATSTVTEPTSAVVEPVIATQPPICEPEGQAALQVVEPRAEPTAVSIPSLVTAENVSEPKVQEAVMQLAEPTAEVVAIDNPSLVTIEIASEPEVQAIVVQTVEPTAEVALVVQETAAVQVAVEVQPQTAAASTEMRFKYPSPEELELDELPEVRRDVAALPPDLWCLVSAGLDQFAVCRLMGMATKAGKHLSDIVKALDEATLKGAKNLFCYLRKLISIDRDWTNYKAPALVRKETAQEAAKHRKAIAQAFATIARACRATGRLTNSKRETFWRVDEDNQAVYGWRSDDDSDNPRYGRVTDLLKMAESVRAGRLFPA